MIWVIGKICTKWPDAALGNKNSILFYNVKAGEVKFLTPIMYVKEWQVTNIYAYLRSENNIGRIGKVQKSMRR